MELTKKYRIAQQRIIDQNLHFDESIKEAVLFLLCYGLAVRMPVGNPARKKKLLIPRIELRLSRTTVFNTETGSMDETQGRVKTNHAHLLYLLAAFNEGSTYKMSCNVCSYRESNEEGSVIICSLSALMMNDLKQEKFHRGMYTDDVIHDSHQGMKAFVLFLREYLNRYQK